MLPIMHFNYYYYPYIHGLAQNPQELQVIYNMKESCEIQHQQVLNTQVKNYLLCKKLGGGTSSTVYLAVNIQSKKEVAIKVIPKQYLNQDKKLMELVKTEIYILKTCDNDNIVRCYDVCQSKLSIFIVMEFCNGLDMHEYILNKKYLSEDHAVWFLKQILNGFKGLHQIGVMHRDFKLANLLLHDRVCKIADLGFAKEMKDQDLTETILGTQITMAPEVLQKKPYGMNADIWSLGVVFYQMLTGKYPYRGNNRSQLLKNIKAKSQNFSDLRISPLAKDFIQGCLTENPAQRISWMQIYNHGLLNKRTVQLTYGISNTSEIFFNNQQFYRRQTMNDESQESLLILRSSDRKEVIIGEILEIKLKASECDAMYRSSMEHEESSRLMITYSIHYGSYLNQLCYPAKYLANPPPKLNQNQTHQGALYLIIKKAKVQIHQFLHVLEKRLNIFKIQLMWTQFLKCSLYSDIINTVKNCAERTEALYSKLANQLKDMGNLNPRIKQQLGEENVKSEEFRDLINQSVKVFVKDAMKVLAESENEALDILDFSEALLYYSDTKMLLFHLFDKSGNKKKLSPERFDWSRSKKIDFKQAKADLLNKFKLITN